jgi:hypothetical protein
MFSMISDCQRVVLCVCVCIVACGSAAAQDSGQGESTRQIAERLVDEVTARPFGTPRGNWRNAVPSARWLDFQGPAGYPSNRPTGYRQPEGRWCSVADDERGRIGRRAVFYASRTQEPLDCRLEQITYVIDPVGDQSGSAALYGEIASAFTRRLGLGRAPGPESDVVRTESARRGSASPREAFLHWSEGTYDIHVFIAGVRVGVVARQYTTSEVLTAPRPLPVSVDMLFKEALLQRLWPQHAGIAELLLDQSGFLETSRAIPAVTALLTRLNRTTNPGDRAWLALAAEEILVRLSLPEQEPAPARRRELAELAPFDLHFEYDGHGDSWEYARGLSAAVVSRYPHTDWGQLAFVRRISGNFEVVECRDIYTETVEQGIEWLKRFPTSRYRLQVIEAVAEAYETWWSLSKAPEDDEFGSQSRDWATPGAPRARVEAIAWYERLLKELPPGVPTQGIVQTLIHLKLDVDTGQRGFHCAIP